MKTRRMARAIADASDAAGKSPTIKKAHYEASSVKEYATVDPIFRKPSPRGGEVFFGSVPDGVFNLLSSFQVLDDYKELQVVINKNKELEVRGTLGEESSPVRSPRKAAI